MDLATVITSAAVGAVAAAVVGVIGQALERRSRNKEMLLAKAVELAVERIRLTLEVAKASQQDAALKDAGITCATYYQWLRHLLDHGELPPDAVHSAPGQPPAPAVIRRTGSRRGWWRLLVALSVAWPLVICSVAAYEYLIARPSDQLRFVTWVPGSAPDPRHPNIIWDVPSLKVKAIALAAALPLGVAWVVGPLAVRTASWVRAGFEL